VSISDMNQEEYKRMLVEAQVPELLADQAADRLVRQDAGELPCPLEGEDLHIVNSAHAWMIAKGNERLMRGKEDG
jgi:hypothetical protein